MVRVPQRSTRTGTLVPYTTLVRSDHEWVEGAWGPWSSTCSTMAVHTRAVTCKRKFDGTLVADSECPAPKPATSETNAVYSRSEEHTSELQSLMRISYDVFCLKNKTQKYQSNVHNVIRTTITI